MEGAREIGPANPNETVDVTIRLRSRAGKKPIVTADEFTKPIEKRTILSRKEFEQRHGADPESIARVESFAREHKLTVKEKSPARRTVILSGHGHRSERGFWRRIEGIRSPQRQVSRAHRIDSPSCRTA